jgi:hypothetical protein
MLTLTLILTRRTKLRNNASCSESQSAPSHPSVTPSQPLLYTSHRRHPPDHKPHQLPLPLPSSLMAAAAAPTALGRLFLPVQLSLFPELRGRLLPSPPSPRTRLAISRRMAGGPPAAVGDGSDRDVPLLYPWRTRPASPLIRVGFCGLEMFFISSWLI